jgi:RimJ/RimL family protein N-acetyltransferase
MHDLVSHNPLTWPRQLSRYVAERLQCEPGLLERPGLHLVAARRPRLRVWQYIVPLWIMAFEDSAVISVVPQMAAGGQRILGSAAAANLLDDQRTEQFRLLAARWAPVEWFARGLWLYCTGETFAPRYATEVVVVPRDHPEGKAMRERHRGEVFGVFRGAELISRSSIKTESDQAWEIAVTTAEPHRRQGLGASVVSRATQYILEQGKLALYNCDLGNIASLRLAESLGYRLFARDLWWLAETAWLRWFWPERAGAQ